MWCGLAVDSRVRLVSRLNLESVESVGLSGCPIKAALLKNV